MAEADFFSDEGRRRASAAIASVEAQTSAELVLQVRHFAGRYREADYLWGLVGALATLVVLLYAERAFPLVGFPLQVALGFAALAALSAHLPPLRRLMTRRRLRDGEVHRAARAAFVELGVARCSGRWGILILVSTFERRVEVICDLGVDVEQLGTPWRTALAALEAAVARYDLSAFLGALESLGPLLAAHLPHRADDRNELPDEPAAETSGDREP